MLKAPARPLSPVTMISRMVFSGALGQQGMERLSGLWIVDIGSRYERLQDVRQHLRIGTRGQGALLRAAQFRGRDGLHGLRDLPRVDHAADTAPDVENVGHGSVPGSQFSVLSF